MNITRRILLKLAALFTWRGPSTWLHAAEAANPQPFGAEFPNLDSLALGEWWSKKSREKNPPPPLDVPRDEKPGPNPVPGSPLPWTGDFKDGLGNKISMLAYANPADVKDEKQRADGYGLARFHKKTRKITFECWPRFSEKEQFPGWPITVAMDANDGRKVAGHLPELIFEGAANPVVQVVEEKSGDILYTIRAQDGRFRPRVYAPGKYTVKIGRDRPDAQTLAGLEAGGGERRVKL